MATGGRGRPVGRATQLEREFAELLRTQAPGDWVTQANCRDRSDDLMFPTGDEGSELYRRQVEEARAVCAWCPVRTACLEHALSAGEDAGVWAGTTPDERRAMRRRAGEEKGA